MRSMCLTFSPAYHLPTNSKLTTPCMEFHKHVILLLFHHAIMSLCTTVLHPARPVTFSNSPALALWSTLPKPCQCFLGGSLQNDSKKTQKIVGPLIDFHRPYVPGATLVYWWQRWANDMARRILGSDAVLFPTSSMVLASLCLLALFV